MRTIWAARGPRTADIPPYPAPEPAPEPPGPLWRRGWVRAVVVLLGLGVALVLLRDQVPSPGAVLAVARTADPVWVVAAVAAQLTSLLLFGLQQRRLLRAFDIRLPVRGALALAVTRSAMAIGLPAGSAVSAGYAFKHFRARGADRATAATTVVLSNTVSTIAMLLLYLVGALVLVLLDLVRRWGPGPAIAAVVAFGGLIGLAVRWRREHAERAAVAGRALGAEPDPHPLATAIVGALHRPGLRWPKLGAWFDHVAQAVSEVAAIRGRAWTSVIGLAVANWCADVACLLAVTRAFGLDVDLLHVGGLYLTVQVARQLPFTPGGVGLIEAGLLAGFAAIDVSAGSAAAVVLGYRLLSCWLLLPVGLVTWWALRRSVSAERHDDNVARDATHHEAIRQE